MGLLSFEAAADPLGNSKPRGSGQIVDITSSRSDDATSEHVNDRLADIRRGLDDADAGCC